MVLVLKFGQMEPHMKDNGKMIKLKEKVSLNMQMVIYVIDFIDNLDDGEWENDKTNGFGIYIHADGSKYEGLWKDDK